VSPGGGTSVPVAVVVVSWNTRDLLDACLRSRRSDHDAGRASVWVVDNGSTDGSAELVCADHSWATLVRRPDNPGFGAAVNDGAARSASAWVVAANADTAVNPTAIATLLDAGARHPHAGILAPRLIGPSGETQHSMHPFPGLAAALAVDLGLARLIPGAGRRMGLEGRVDPQRECDVDWAHGAFLMVRRDLWTRLGGFDAGMWLYAEDLDLCWRARATGSATRYVPAAQVTHHISAATAQAWGDARAERAQRAAREWMLRRLGRRRTAAITVIAALGGTARVALLRVATRVAPARFGWRLERAQRMRAVAQAALQPEAPR
jgi:GT2 family glycosyltransferase